MLTGHKLMKDCCTLSLCTNACRDYEVKLLLVCHWENPRALKTHEIKKKSSCHVDGECKGVGYEIIFVKWMNLTCPTVKKYLEKNKLQMKCLMIFDNAPVQRHSVEDNILKKKSFIKVQYFPPNTTHLLQPMDQQVISNFKKLHVALGSPSVDFGNTSAL